MTTNHLKMQRLVFAMILSSLGIAATAGAQQATYNTGVPVGRSHEGHPPGPCQGRCQYCVDGQCIPRQETFGFYETQWRRWPIEAPAVVAKPRQRQIAKPELGPAAEVPAPHTEADVNPEFPHLRKTRPGTGAPLTPAAPLPSGKQPARNDVNNPFRDDLGSLPLKTPATSPSAANAATRAVVPADYSALLVARDSNPNSPNPANAIRGSNASTPGPATGTPPTHHQRRDQPMARDNALGAATMPGNPLRLSSPRPSATPARATAVPIPLPKPNPQVPAGPPRTANPLRHR